jgi:hypothetical protein
MTPEEEFDAAREAEVEAAAMTKAWEDAKAWGEKWRKEREEAEARDATQEKPE